MLLELKVRNFAIIEKTDLQFSGGLTVLTGETGAGKSILVDAVEVLLGGKVTTEDIRTGTQEGWVEALFDINNSPHIENFLQEHGIPLSDHVLVIRRTLSRSGKNRIFLNDQSVTLSTLQKVGEMLVDLHGQHSHQSLLQVKNHLNHLDDFRGGTRELESFRESFHRFKKMEEELKVLGEKIDSFLRQSEDLKFQLSEIRDADLSLEEEEELKRERDLLVHGHQYRQWIEEVYALLQSDEGVLKQLQTASVIFQNIQKIDPKFNEVYDLNASSLIGLQEVSHLVRQYRDQLEVDPDRLEATEKRLFQIERLKRKFGKETKEILEWADSVQKDMEHFEMVHEEFEKKRGLLDGEFQQLVQSALVLSSVRRKKARDLEKHMERELKELRMEKCSFRVSLNTPESLERSHLGLSGGDTVEFLISPNPGEGLKPLSCIASGGELSRIMLAMRTPKGLVEEKRTLIFDEVDAGLGGAVAEVVGEKLKMLSQNHQVFCITHLPQIATQADEHFVITKHVEELRTVTSATRLNSAQKVKEIARMLGGKKITSATVAHAKEMLDRIQT